MRLHEQALLESRDRGLGHVEIELDRVHVVERRDHRRRRNEASKAHPAQTHPARERRPHLAVREARLSRRESCFGGVAPGDSLVELGSCDSPGLEELAAAAKLVLDLHEVRARFGDVGNGLGALELHEHVARLHALALREVDGRDDLGDLGADLDRLVGLGGAECFDGKRK